MKKELIFLAVLLIALPLISAVQIKMNPSYAQGETLLAKISGNFVDQIAPSNIIFYRGHVEIPMVYGVTQYNGDFYVYASLVGKTPANYSMEITGVRYYNSTRIISDPLYSYFSITDRTADFSVVPGFVQAGNNFSVGLTDLNNSEINVSIEPSSGITASSNYVQLNTGQTKNITFSISNPGQLDTVHFNTLENSSTNGTSYTFYAFPYSPSQTQINNNTIQSLEPGLEIQPQLLNVSMATNSSGIRIIYLYNTGNTDLKNVRLNVSTLLQPFVTISETEVNISQNSSAKVELTITSPINESLYQGTVNALVVTGNSSNLTATTTLLLDFIQNFIPTEGQNSSVPSVKTCQQVGGQICSDNSTCSGNIFHAADGTCCLGTCQAASSGVSTSWIGWAIIALVLIFIYWFYRKRYKKAK